MASLELLHKLCFEYSFKEKGTSISSMLSLKVADDELIRRLLEKEKILEER